MTHIAVDMDDVVLDFFGGVRDAVQREYGIVIPDKDCNQWDLHPLLDPILGRSWWSWLREREWLWANFPAIDGAIGGVETLRRRGHYLELVTSKPEWAEHNVWKWLGKWRPAFQRVTIVGPNGSKPEATQAAILIDDKPDNCLDFVKAGRDALLFDRPHNRDYSEGPAIRRAKNWREVLEVIQ